MGCRMPGFPVHHHLPEFVQTHVHWVGDAIQPSHPLPSPSPAFSLSQHQGLFQWVRCIRWPKSGSFSFSICAPTEQSRLISFRIDWFALLAVQGTLSKADVNWPRLKTHLPPAVTLGSRWIPILQAFSLFSDFPVAQMTQFKSMVLILCENNLGH